MVEKEIYVSFVIRNFMWVMILIYSIRKIIKKNIFLKVFLNSIIEKIYDGCEFGV